MAQNGVNIPTHSTRVQTAVEKHVKSMLDDWEQTNRATRLYKPVHINYLKSGFYVLPQMFSMLDASRPWVCYWILHSMDLLGGVSSLEKGAFSRVVDTLSRCRHPNGGYAGGPQQLPHLAPTYASVAALFVVGTKEAYDSIDRTKVYNYFLRMKTPQGGFQVHEGGEVDIRGTYTAIAVAGMLNMLTPELVEGCAEWLASCQRYDGGMGGEPGMESHGGYAYCGVAALAILNRLDAIDCDALLKWAAARQMSVEGGFCGRTHKLVDGCYSFWVGALFSILSGHGEMLNSPEAPSSSTNSQPLSSSSTSSSAAHVTSDDESKAVGDSTSSEPKSSQDRHANASSHSFPYPFSLMDHAELQKYITVCCQSGTGGLVDKPPKPADYYHTCYCLSGLSIAQHRDTEINVLGGDKNRVKQTDPLYNVDVVKLRRGLEYFAQMPLPAASTSSEGRSASRS